MARIHLFNGAVTRLTRGGLVGLLLLATACVSVDRPGAQVLGKAGVDAATALTDELRGRERRVSRAILLHNFNQSYSRLRFCGQPGHPELTSDGREGDCDVVHQARLRNREIPQLLGGISERFALRARATERVASAYRALIAEAEYDARGELEPAIREAATAVSALGVATGIGALPAVLGEAAAGLAGLLADGAQRRRLVEGSRRLQIISRHLRLALERERELYRQTDVLIGGFATDTRENLVAVTPLASLLASVMSASNLPVPGEGPLQVILTQNPRLRAATQVAHLAQPAPDGDAALDAAIRVLATLELQHSKFQGGRPVSLAEMSAAIDRLTSVVEALEEEEEE
ncbi:MAG TPA: hypothetical protein VGB54_07750 [Allosphingosinicella sp.]|jgi:hypothetical protein